MAFSLDEFLDPLIRDAGAEFEPNVPVLLRNAYRKLVDVLVKVSLDDAAKRIVERLIDHFLKSDGSQPFTGFALANVSASEAEQLEEAVGFDPLTILTLISFGIQVIEWLRKRRQPVALAASAPGSIVEGRVVSALLLTPDLTLEIGEGLKLERQTPHSQRDWK